MTLYIWLEQEKAEKAAAEGLSPEGEGIPGVRFAGIGKAYLVAFLHPADAGTASGRKVCLKLNIEPGEVRIFDAARIDEKARESLIPADRYRLGTYRRPWCVIARKITPEEISFYDSRMDEPLLYENSEKLYVDRIFELADDTDPGFRELAVKAYLEGQVAAGRAVKYSGPACASAERIAQSGDNAGKSGAGSRFRFLRQRLSGEQDPGGSGAETAEEYRNPDGTLLGVTVTKRR